MDLMLLSLSLKVFDFEFSHIIICFSPVIGGESEQRQGGATYCQELFLKELELFLKELFKTCARKKLRNKIWIVRLEAYSDVRHGHLKAQGLRMVFEDRPYLLSL